MHPWPTLRLALVLLAQALPLMLLLFVFFPRIGPLWSLPNPSNQSLSGLSDSMTPADVAELSQSDALVFRATFNGSVPPREQLYWRALTLEHFDGRRWSQAPISQLSKAPLWQKIGPELSYEVIMQPSGKPWLYTLDVPQLNLPMTQALSDFSVQRTAPVEQPLQYQAHSWPEALREPQEAADVRRALQLPQTGDPRSRAWAVELKGQYPQADALVQALLQHFNREPFGYTLKPPPVGLDSIDEFLFRTRRGFCAHYAGAMTFVLRAAGIPARVVAGYQGGEINSAGNYLTVRQFDAHAWVEYWQPEQGWRRVDPTFQVAPERIEQGLEEAVSGEQSFLDGSPLSLLRYRHIGWLNQARLAWDNLNYGWQRWVLGYQGERQLQVLQRWFGQVDSQLRITSLVGGGALLLTALALLMFKPWRREQSPLLRQHLRFQQLLARHGVWHQPGEGPRDYAARAAQQLPAQAAAIQAFTELFEQQQYAASAVDTRQLRRALWRLRRALPWRLTRAEP